MKVVTGTLLAAALAFALPVDTASACTVSQWSGASKTATDADTGSPADGVARYSGVCALEAGTGVYVVDDKPSNDGTYRARFYVLTGSGNVTIFSAVSGNDGAGTPVVEVDFTGSSFDFKQNGSSAGTVTGIQSGKWYSIELFYKAGSTFSATVAGAGSDAEIGSASSSSVGTGTINSAKLGVVSGTASAPFNFDSFESTRSESSEIGRLCRGDVNNDGTFNVQDRIMLNLELTSAGATPAPGQPDCNEDGSINTMDRICLNLRISNVEQCL